MCFSCVLFSGEGGKSKEHKTSIHAIRSILKNEGLRGMYTGFVCFINTLGKLVGVVLNVCVHVLCSTV